MALAADGWEHPMPHLPLAIIQSDNIRDIPTQKLENIFKCLVQTYPSNPVDTFKAAEYLWQVNPYKTPTLFSLYYTLGERASLPKDFDECLDMPVIVSLLTNFARNGRLEQMQQVLKRMQNSLIPPGPHIFNLFMQTWLSNGNLTAFQLHALIQHLNQPSPKQPFVLKKSNDGVDSIWIAQFFNEIKPNGYTYTLLIDSLQSSSAAFDHAKLFHEMTLARIPITAHHLNPIMVFASDQRRENFHALIALLDTIPPNVKSLRLILEHFAKLRDWNNFKRYFKAFRETWPDLVTQGPAEGLDETMWELPLFESLCKTQKLEAHLLKHPTGWIGDLFRVKSLAQSQKFTEAKDLISGTIPKERRGLAWSFLFPSLARQAPHLIPEYWSAIDFEEWGEEENDPYRATQLFLGTVIRPITGPYSQSLLMKPADNPIGITLKHHLASITSKESPNASAHNKNLWKRENSTEAIKFLKTIPNVPLSSFAVELALNFTLPRNLRAGILFLTFLKNRGAETGRFWIHACRVLRRGDVINLALVELTKSSDHIGLGLLYQHVLLDGKLTHLKIPEKAELVMKEWLDGYKTSLGHLALVSWILWKDLDPIPELSVLESDGRVAALLLAKAYATLGNVEKTKRVVDWTKELRISDGTRRNLDSMIVLAHTRQSYNQRKAKLTPEDNLDYVEKAWTKAVASNVDITPTATLKMDALHFTKSFTLADEFYQSILTTPELNVGENFYCSYVECLMTQSRMEDVFKVVEQREFIGDKLLLRALEAFSRIGDLQLSQIILKRARPTEDFPHIESVRLLIQDLKSD